MKTGTFQSHETSYTVKLDNKGTLSVYRGTKSLSVSHQRDWSNDDVELEASRISQEEGIDETELLSAMRYVIGIN